MSFEEEVSKWQRYTGGYCKPTENIVELELEKLRICYDEIRQHLNTLWELSGGITGKRPPDMEED